MNSIEAPPSRTAGCVAIAMGCPGLSTHANEASSPETASTGRAVAATDPTGHP